MRLNEREPALDCERRLADLGQPEADYIFCLIGTIGSREIAYQNYIHPSGRTIICVSNFKANDNSLALPWSTIMALAYKTVVAQNGGNVKSLETI